MLILAKIFNQNLPDDLFEHLPSSFSSPEIVVILWCNLCAGCGWFAVGQVEGFEKSWVSEHFNEADGLLGKFGGNHGLH